LSNTPQPLHFANFLRVVGSELDVSLLHNIGTGQNAGAGNTSEDVGSGSLHHAHKALVLQDLLGAIDRTVVFDGTAGRHHHAPSDSVNWVRSETRHDSNGPSEEEGENSTSAISEHDWLDGVVESKVETSVDEDTHARDDKSSVETANSVRGQGLSVDVDESVVLSLAVLALGVVGQSSTGKIERVDDCEGERTGDTTTGNVSCELSAVRGVLGRLELSLDGVFEGKVESLGWEVSEDVGQVTSPERGDTLGGQGSLGAIHDAGVWLVKSTLLDHLILVLDEKLDSLDRGGGRLGDTGGNTREHKVLGESKFLGSHFKECKEESVKKSVSST